MRPFLTLPQRVTALAVYIFLLMLVSRLVTGVWMPPSGGKNLWFVSSIGLWFFTQLSTPFFVKPRDAVARSALTALTLGIVDLPTSIHLSTELNVFRWITIAVASLTSVAGILAIFLHRTRRNAGTAHAYFSRVAYRFAERFGRGQVIFTPPVLISILGFYQDAPLQQLWLIFFWTILVFLQPVELVFHLVGDFRVVKATKTETTLLGEIKRIDHPGIVRVKLKSTENWMRQNVVAVCLADSKQVEVLPLFVQTQGAELIGTGICHRELPERITGLSVGDVFVNPSARNKVEIINELSGGTRGELVGFVVENSTISQIQFEVSSEAELREGSVVAVVQKINSRDTSVYYQIVNATGDEESFYQNPLGRHIAAAEQLGIFDAKRGFVRYGWLPEMNSPVFLIGESTSLELQLSEEEFAIGFVPYSKIPVGANLGELVEYHTAILGVTGTGKTELAYDILRFAIKRGFKVFCVDLTGEYEERLKDLNPILLALEDADAEELNDKIFRAETSKFGNEEKGALLQEIEKLRRKIELQVKSFLEPQEEAALAILRLDEIANTRATLRITELYLSTIFEMARKNRGARRILVVLEEAHTIVPEMNVYGRFDRSETEAVVGRTAQIALQGRKYGVGLLLVSQRTALVSKTLLSQCNTVLSFAMHDETGLRYLSNVFSTSYVTAIPNLKRFEAVAFGKGIKSERPVIFQIPDVPAKRKASEELKKTWLPEAVPAQPAAVPDERAPAAVAEVEIFDDEDGTGAF